jgi:hypothetical protein
MNHKEEQRHKSDGGLFVAALPQPADLKKYAVGLPMQYSSFNPD